MALDFQSSRTLSLGGSGRGGAMLTDTITLNPSMLGFQPVAALSGTYNWLNPDAGNNFNVAVIDGRNPYVNAGFSFTRKTSEDLFHLSLAKRVVPWLAVGVSGKRFATRSNATAATGGSQVGYDGGLSATVALPTETVGIPLQFGIVGDNLANRVENERYIGPRQLGTGIKANLNNILLLYGDYVQNFSNLLGNYSTLSGGLEVALGSEIFARAGAFGFRENGWSAGIGWVGPKIGIAYGYQNRRFDAERSFSHAVTADIFM